jgi:hypothetical protein
VSAHAAANRVLAERTSSRTARHMHAQCQSSERQPLAVRWAPHEALLSALPFACARMQRVPIKAYLNAGNNTLTFRISPAADAARQRAKEYPYKVPYLCTPTAQHPPLFMQMCVAGCVATTRSCAARGSGKHVRAFVQRAAVVSACRKDAVRALICAKQLVWHVSGGLSTLCTAGWHTMCSWAVRLRVQVRGADCALQLPAQARV